MANVGTAYVTILPEVRSFGRQLTTQVVPPSDAAGSESGRRFGSGFARSVGGMLKTGVVAGVTGALAGIGAGAVWGVKIASQNEQAQISFTTMLGSAEKAGKFLTDLQNFAAKTPFEFPELQTAASSLVSVGVSADKVVPIMTSLGNATAGMGTGSEGIKRATVALQQMNAAQRISGDDLNQLRNAGIPVYDLLSKATGKSTQEVVKMAQAGKLGKTELDALMKALESGKGLERFSGLMDAQSASLAGMWSTFKDTFGQGLARAVQPAIPIIKNVLGQATVASQAFFDGLQGKATQGASGVVKALSKFGLGVRAMVQAFKDGDVTSDGFVGKMQKIGLVARGVYDKLKAFFSGGFKTGDTGAALGSLGDSFQKIMPAIQDLIGQLPSLSDVLSVGATMFGFLADHIGLVEKAMPAIVAGFVLYKASQLAANVALTASIPLRMAEVAASFTQSSAMRAHTAALVSNTATITGNTAAENVGLLTRIRGVASMVASKVATIAASAATKAYAAGQWLLNAAMSANPIGLIVIALAAVVGGLIYAYTHSEKFRAIVQAAFTMVKNVATGLLNFFKNNWRTILMFLTGPIGIAVGLIIRYWSQIKNAVMTAVRFVGNLLKNAAIAYLRFQMAVWSAIGKVISFMVSLPGKILGALASLGGRLVGLARSAFGAMKDTATGAVGGLLDYVRGLPGQIISGLGNLAGLLVSAGGDLIRGLIEGIGNMAKAAVDAVKGVASDAIGAAKNLLGISSPSTVFASFGRFVAEGFAKGVKGSAKQAVSAVEKLATLATRIMRENVKGTRKASLATAIAAENKQLQGLISKRLDIANRLKKAQEAITKAPEMRENVASNVLEAGSFTDLGGEVGTIKQHLADVLENTRRFQANIALLKKRGLGDAALSQIIAAGVDEGGATAEGLARASKADLAQINLLEKQLGTAATATGKTASDAMFGVGGAAAKGLIDGLKRSEASIAKQMQNVAAGMKAAIKKALGIRSPSRVFAEYGAAVADGFALGISGGQRAVGAASARLAGAASMNAATSAPRAVASLPGAGTPRAGANIVVNADVRETADVGVLINRLEFESRAGSFG